MEHANKNADECSGGTRRKLSFALAMVGSPRVVLLDEPSTGMDPRSKRFLWDTILASFQVCGWYWDTWRSYVGAVSDLGLRNLIRIQKFYFYRMPTHVLRVTLITSHQVIGVFNCPNVLSPHSMLKSGTASVDWSENIFISIHYIIVLKRYSLQKLWKYSVIPTITARIIPILWPND